MNPWLRPLSTVHRSPLLWLSLIGIAGGAGLPMTLTEPAIGQTPSETSSPATKIEKRVLIAEVVVRGIEGELQDLILETVRTKPGAVITRSDLQADINAIFETGYFANVKADPSDEATGVRVTFTVVPNPELKRVQFTTQSEAKLVLPDSIVQESFSPQYGKRLNLRSLQAGIKTVLEWYKRNGYTLATTVGDPQVTQNGVVTVQVAEGIVEAVQVQFITKDNKTTDAQGKPIQGKTSIATILESIKTAPGQVFNQPQMEKDLQQIFKLGAFEDVKVSLQPGKQPQQVIVVLRVLESETARQSDRTIYQAALQQAQTVNNLPKMAELLQQIGDTYDLKEADQRSTALSKYQEAQKIYQQLKDTEKEAALMQRMGNLLFVANAYREAVSPYRTALRLHQARRNTTGTAIVLNNLGNTYKTLKDYTQALVTYQQALLAFEALNEPFWQALTYNNLAAVQLALNDPDRAIALYNQALARWQTIQQLPQPLSSTNTATVDDRATTTAITTPAQTQSTKNEGTISLALVLSSKRGITVDTQLNIGQGGLNEIVVADRNLWLGATLISLGGTFQSVGDYQQALTLIQAGVAQMQIAMSNPKLQKGINPAHAHFLPTLANLTETLIALSLTSDLGWQGSSKQLRQTLVTQLQPFAGWIEQQLKQKINPSNEIVATIIPLGVSLGQQLLPALMKGSDEQGGLQFLAADDGQLLTWMQSVRAKLPQLLAQSKDAQQWLSNPQVLQLLRWIDLLTQKSIANQYQKKGNYQEALAAYNEALVILQAAKSSADPASVATAQGLMQELKQSIKTVQQGNPKQALNQLTTVLQRSLQPSQMQLAASNKATSNGSSSNTFNRALGLVNGMFYSMLGQQQVDMQNAVGKTLLSMGKLDAAIAAHRQALASAKTSKKPEAEAKTLTLIGAAYEKANQYSQALEAYQQALGTLQGSKSVLEEADTRLAMAKLERKRGNLQQAKVQIEAAIERIESPDAQTSYQQQQEAARQSNNNDNNSSNLPPDPKPAPTQYSTYVDLAKYLASKQSYYAFYIDLLMQQHQTNPNGGYDQLAFLASERSRARSLRAMLRRAQQDPSVTATQLGKAIALDQSPSFTTIQQMLDDRTLVLEYALGDERSYLWAVSRAGIQSYVLPKRADIEAAFQQFNQQLLAPGYRLEPQEQEPDAVAQFSQLLLQPVADQLTNQRIVVVSDGVLQYVPFAALLKPKSASHGQPLLVDHEIVGLPAVSILATLQAQPTPTPSKNLAILADPIFSPADERLKGQSAHTIANSQRTSTTRSVLVADPNFQSIYTRLPGTRQEATQILQMVRNDRNLVKLDEFASRAVAMSPELAQYRIIHFATHGILDAQRPQRSGVILSVVDDRGNFQRSLLSTADVFNLRLNAELVVLSGCETALGEEIKGEGLVGLSGGFMYAGARKVVSSLWNVDDDGTAELMTAFYDRLLRQGIAPDAALREAQLELMNSAQWYSPRYWAAFVVQGN